MPTKDWFKENPKVSAYLSAELNQSLKEWMRKNGIKKTSVGITTIIEQFLKVNQSKPLVDQKYVTVEQLNKIEKEIESLKQQFKNKTQPEKRKSRPKPSNLEPDNEEWMTTREAFEKYGKSLSWNSFRKLKPKDFLKRFRIEADTSRKSTKSNTSRWLKKLDQTL